jgi:chromosome segregation ATPase
LIWKKARAKISLSNNESKIAELQTNIKASAVKKDNGVISKFNESSQIRVLEDENRDLNLELKTYQTYLKNFETQKNGLVPFQYEIEKMNASHEFEYKIYASLNDSLARIGLQKTYVKNKVEILELERISRVHSSPPLLIMILIALTISQVFGIFSIYVYELFKPAGLDA